MTGTGVVRSGPTPTVGWYLHHHGAGHLTRFLAIRPFLDSDIVVFSSLAAPESLPDRTRWVQLARDDDPDSDGFRSPTAGGLLHWSPIGNAGYKHRMATISGQLHQNDCRALVVDVSVEICLLGRLLGLPVIVFTQPGMRTDLPHQLAYRAADRIVAAWPEPTEHPAGLGDWPDKVRYVGGISRFEGRTRVEKPIPGRVLVLGGGGGAGVSTEDVELAQGRTPGTSWESVGVQSRINLSSASDASHRAANGNWVSDPWPALCAAEVVISWAGQNAVADLAAVDARAIVIPQTRPFDEQVDTARTLEDLGFALTLHEWPKDRSWTAIIDAARALNPQWSRWQVIGAAGRAAAVINEVAR